MDTLVRRRHAMALLRPLEDVDEREVRAIVDALDRFDARARRQPLRIPKGFKGGGRFRSINDTIFDALDRWAKGQGPNNPFDDPDVKKLNLTREHYRRAAKARGITLKRGATEDEIKAALLNDMRARKAKATPAKATAKSAPAVSAKKAPAKAAKKATKAAPAKKAVPPAQLAANLQQMAQAVGGSPNPPATAPSVGVAPTLPDGITVKRWVSPFRNYAASVDVYYGGEKLGTIHDDTALTGGWIAFASDGRGRRWTGSSLASTAATLRQEYTHNPWKPAQRPPAVPVRVKDAVERHVAEGGGPNDQNDPLSGFTRAQLTTAANHYNVSSPVGSTRRQLSAELIDRLTPLPAGVTVTPFASGALPGMSASLTVHVNGVHVGAIHRDALTGTWEADPVASIRGQHTPTSGATRAQAVQSLATATQAVNASGTVPPVGAKLIPRNVAGAPNVYQVSVQPRSDTFGPAKESLDIYVGGTKIGQADQWSFGWLGEDIHGNPIGAGRTKSSVVSTLVAQHQPSQTPRPNFTSRDIGGGTTVVAANGTDIGAVTGHPYGFYYHPTPTSGIDPGTSPDGIGPYASQSDAVNALQDAFIAANQPAPAPAPRVHPPEAQAALAIVYGTDPKGKTVTRQLQVYGAMRKSHFDGLSGPEKGTVLADLSFVATTSKSASTKSRAQKLLDRFAPAGTPPGTVAKQAVHTPPGATGTQTRVDDPDGTPGLLSILHRNQRGRNGDGWTRTTSGGSGPWGQYGAAGLLLRHVDDQGEERFLMIERGPGISDPGKWQFPGGAKDENEDFYQGATREVVEELGLKAGDLAGARVHGTHIAEVANVQVKAPRGGQVPWAYVSIAATVDRQLAVDLSGSHAQLETSQAKWMTRAEIAQLDAKGKLLAPLAGGALDRNVMTLFPDTRVQRPGPVTVRPPRLTGTPSAPKAPPVPYKRSRATNLIPDKASTDKLRADVAVAKKAYKGKTADSRLAAIGAMQGFDETPTVVDKAEFDRLLATGDYIEIWRGVQGAGAGWRGPGRGGQVTSSKTAAQVNEELRSGPAYYGVGMYGNGYYFATSRSVARGYSDGTTGSMVRALLPRSATIRPHPQVEREAHRIGSPTSAARGSHGESTLWDEGRYAAAVGLDAIEIPHRSGSHVAPSANQPAYNVLNRSILIVEEA